MILLGLVLLILGLVFGMQLLTLVGAVLLVVGLTFEALSQVGRPVRGRRWW